jgi:hypothetical protein
MPFQDPTPAEAFRMLLRVWRPGPLADEIESYDWFRAYYRHHRPRSAEEVDDAKKALELLRRNVQSGTVRLRGVLYTRVKGVLESQGPPVFIDLADQHLGDLNVFDARLIRYETGWRTSHDYREVFCVKSDVDKIVKSITATSLSPQAKAGGRPPAVDWSMVDEEVLRLMDENNEFSADDPDWNAQARLEEAIADYCETKFGKRPGDTTIKDNIRDPLKRWRERRTET